MQCSLGGILLFLVMEKQGETSGWLTTHESARWGHKCSVGPFKFTNIPESLECMCIIAVLSIHEANAINCMVSQTSSP